MVNVSGTLTLIWVESYTYDESGNRITSTNYTGSQPITTYYVYDAKGSVMAIYTQSGSASPVEAEVPVYGSGRLGTYFVPGANYVYEIRDNVGSVRVAITGEKNGNQASIYKFDDYFPYGSIAQSGESTYRYDYQGAYSEKDAVTGYNNFKLRMYDGRIGRWLSVDPAGQFASPYEGMGDDPVIGSDPDGGETEWHYHGLNLVADAGDNAQTLSDFLHIDLNTAQNIFGNIANWDNGKFVNQGFDLTTDIAGHILTRGDPSWLTTAKGEYGVSETGGDGGPSNSRILQYFKATSTSTKTDQTPWCAAFQNWVLKQNRIMGTDDATARSFKTWGQKLKKPALGALFVLPNNHHVTEFMGMTKDGRYLMLGGNQGDAVSVTPYKPTILTGGTIVYPTGMTPNYNLPILNVNFSLNYKTR